MYTTLLFLDVFIAEYLMLIMTALSLAVLFVYRSKRLNAFPWIVMAIMELTFLVMGLVGIGRALLWCRSRPLIVTFKDFTSTMQVYYEYFGYVGLRPFVVMIVSAIPILALWVMLIVGAVQKKKKAS